MFHAGTFDSQQRPGQPITEHMNNKTQKHGQLCFTIGVVVIGTSPTKPTLSPRLTSQLTPRCRS